MASHINACNAVSNAPAHSVSEFIKLTDVLMTHVFSPTIHRSACLCVPSTSSDFNRDTTFSLLPEAQGCAARSDVMLHLGLVAIDVLSALCHWVKVHTNAQGGRLRCTKYLNAGHCSGERATPAYVHAVKHLAAEAKARANRNEGSLGWTPPEAELRTIAHLRWWALVYLRLPLIGRWQLMVDMLVDHLDRVIADAGELYVTLPRWLQVQSQQELAGKQARMVQHQHHSQQQHQPPPPQPQQQNGGPAAGPDGAGGGDGGGRGGPAHGGRWGNRHNNYNSYNSNNNNNPWGGRGGRFNNNNLRGRGRRHW